MPFCTSVRVAAVTGTVLTAAAVLTTAPASAAPPSLLRLSYDVTGSTTLTNPNSKATVDFAPTVLDSAIDLNRTPAPVTADLPLAPVATSFKAFGFLPAKGTVVFTQVRPVRGFLDLSNADQYLTATAYYVVSLRNVVIGGTNANVGTNCQTVYPVKVSVISEPDFAELTSGTFSGVYDLGRFQNCGNASQIINDTLPGRGNTLTLKVTLRDDAAAGSAVAAVRAAGA